MKKASEINIGVVGAGNMGAGIAQKYATQGINVTIVDQNDQALQRGRQSIDNILEEGQKRKIFNPDKAAAIKSRLSFSCNKQDLAQTDLIIEAIFENKQIKQNLFRELDEICSKKTIFATNTSSFLVSELASVTKRPDRFVGLHYFYHPAKNRLVEVIKGEQTSQKTYDFAWQIQEMCSKTPIDSKDTPGFIVNRFFVPWLNESVRLVEEGVADIATVEAAAKKAFSIGMGPFELMNITGVPVAYHAANSLFDSLGAFYKPCKLILPIIEKKVQWDISGPVDESKFKAVAERLLGVVFYLANQIVFEEKVCSLSDCDLGARVGLRWRSGPFEMMNRLGMVKAANLVKELCPKYSDLKTLAIIGLKLGDSSPYRLELVKSETKDNVGIIIFNRPDSLNALSEEVVGELGEAFSKFERDENIKGIVLTASGKAFVAGADTKFFLNQLKKQNVNRIVDFAANGQKLFWQIDQCEKPVVCCMNGMALGGGLELALACDQIVASDKAIMGFPETSIGIYPGLGGSQRTPRRVGKSLARWLILTGDLLDAKNAQKIGLIDEVLPANELFSRALELAKTGKIVNSRSKTPPQNYNELIRLFERDLASLNKAVSEDERLAKSLKKLSRNAPLAKKTADELIAFSMSNSLKDGLDKETAGLKDIFSSKDAFEGLLSIGKARPSFSGN